MAAPPRNIDLHLLECFELLMRERSVSRVAEYLDISQSSASEMLARLRDRFGDPLLVRSREGLVPTPRAQELLPGVRAAAAQLRGLLECGAAFDAATSRTSFRVTSSDYSQLLLMPQLVQQMLQDAPQCSIDLLPVNILHVEHALAGGELDLAIAYYPEPPASLRRGPLFTDHYVGLARQGHPVLAQPPDAQAFAGLSHVRVAPSGLTYFSSPVETALEELGLRRQLAMSSPQFLLAAYVVSQTDLVLLVPRKAAEALARIMAVGLFDIPLALRPVEISMYWHERTHHSPAHQWLRARVRAILGTPVNPA